MLNCLNTNNSDKFLLCLKLKSQGNYIEAVEIYKDIYHLGTKKDVFSYVVCLNKANHKNKSIAISKELYRKFPDYAENNNYLSFLVYHKYFKLMPDNDKCNINHLIDISISIIKITNQETDSACNIIISKMLMMIKNENPRFHEKSMELLNVINYKKLENTTQIRSIKEEYFLCKSKILFEIKKFEECLFCCDEALKNMTNLNYTAFSKITSRKAKTLSKLNKYELAINEFEKIYSLNSHWSKFFDIAEIYFDMKKYDKALFFYCKAAITSKNKNQDNYKEVGIKIKIYSRISEVLYNIENYKSSWEHILFAINIREMKNWKIPENEIELYNKLTEYNFEEAVSQQHLMVFWIKKIFEIVGHNQGLISEINYANSKATLLFNDEIYEFDVKNIFANRKLINGENVWFCIESNSLKDDNDLVCTYVMPVEI